jgi:hypothetical protein
MYTWFSVCAPAFDTHPGDVRLGKSARAARTLQHHRSTRYQVYKHSILLSQTMVRVMSRSKRETSESLLFKHQKTRNIINESSRIMKSSGRSPPGGGRGAHVFDFFAEDSGLNGGSFFFLLALGLVDSGRGGSFARSIPVSGIVIRVFQGV